MLNTVSLSYTRQIRQHNNIRTISPAFKSEEELAPPVKREQKKDYLKTAAYKLNGTPRNLADAEKYYSAVHNRAKDHIEEFYGDKGYEVLYAAVDGLASTLSIQAHDNGKLINRKKLQNAIEVNKSLEPYLIKIWRNDESLTETDIDKMGFHLSSNNRTRSTLEGLLNKA